MPTPAKKKAPVKKAAVEEGVSDPPALTPDIIPAPGDPAPITPLTTPAAHQDRVLFENLVNDEADAFARAAKDAFITARLAGQSISITIE